MSEVKNYIRFGATSLLVFGMAFPSCRPPIEKAVTLEAVAPIPELIDVWDAAKVRARGPLLIAHRGGVVAPGAPECSQKAVKIAAAHRYDMVELDVWESKDNHPVVFHDRNMKGACGIDGQISDFTLEAVTQIRFLESDEAITSLDVMLGLCRSLNIGVMFDIKSPDGSDLFFNRVLDLIEKHDLNKACMTLGGSRVREYLKGTALITLPGEMLEKVKQGESVDLHGFFWFGVPKTWPIDLVKPVQENGALVIPALNTFRYSEENHRAEALEDAERLLEAGVDGFQIDSIYQDYFGRSKVQEAK
ncbi:glycerophosphodiester phosphodiesterase [Candidatus Neomarinimicrobiota bacterium]